MVADSGDNQERANKWHQQHGGPHDERQDP
jgi:hypothetical protein